MDVRSRLSENSSSSQEQDVGKTDTSSNDEEDVLTDTTREPLVGVPKLRRENAFRMTETSARRKNLMLTPRKTIKFLKAGLKLHGFGQCKAILTAPTFSSKRAEPLEDFDHIQNQRSVDKVLLNQRTQRHVAILNSWTQINELLQTLALHKMRETTIARRDNVS